MRRQLMFSGLNVSPAAAAVGITEKMRCNSCSANWSLERRCFPGGEASPGQYLDIQAQNHSFEEMSISNGTTMNLTGLAPGTAYNVCPEVSNDGVTWSTGVSAPFTTLPLPAVHPALPIAPSPFVIPASPVIGGGTCGSGSGNCSVMPDCSDLTR